MEIWQKIKDGAGITWIHVTEFVRKYPIKCFLAASVLSFALGAWVL